jgi:hypothetical protein
MGDMGSFERWPGRRRAGDDSASNLQGDLGISSNIDSQPRPVIITETSR